MLRPLIGPMPVLRSWNGPGTCRPETTCNFRNLALDLRPPLQDQSQVADLKRAGVGPTRRREARIHVRHCGRSAELADIGYSFGVRPCSSNVSIQECSVSRKFPFGCMFLYRTTNWWSNKRSRRQGKV